MIIDSDKLEQNNIFEPDLCIVGSGPASLAIVKDMQLSGLNILVLSGGEYKITKKNQNLYKGFVKPKNSHEPLDKYRHRVFGGSGNFWGGRCVPLDEIDFKKRDWIPYSGWPIKYLELMPYYKLASKLLKIDPFYINSFSVGNYKKEIIKGFNNSYITSSKMEYWSPVLNFAKEYKDLFLKKNITLLNNTHATKINTSKNKVTSILALSNNKKIIIKATNYILACGGIENPRLLLVSQNKFYPKGIGNNHNIVGRFYMSHFSGTFVNISPFNRKDLVYNYQQDIKKTYYRYRWWLNEVAQKKKRIGNIIFFLGLTKKPLDSGDPILASVYLFDFFSLFFNKAKNNDLINFLRKEQKIFYINLKIFIKNLFKLFPKIIHIAFKRCQNNRLPSVLPNINSKVLGLYFQSEHTPNYNSRITIEKNKKDRLGLPRVKVEIKFNEIDKKSVIKAHDLFTKRFIDTKAGNLQKKYRKKEIEYLIKQNVKSFNSISHHIGTTRMSKNHTLGVVDKNCKVFGLKNLFITGSSVFPTAGHANPTFTIVALSLRLSKFLKKIYKKK